MVIGVKAAVPPLKSHDPTMPSRRGGSVPRHLHGFERRVGMEPAALFDGIVAGASTPFTSRAVASFMYCLKKQAHSSTVTFLDQCEKMRKG